MAQQQQQGSFVLSIRIKLRSDEDKAVRRCKFAISSQLDPALKALGFNPLKEQCFQDVGLK